MSLLTDVEKALYGQTLVEMSDDELLDERLERLNAMLAANIAVVGTRNNPTLPSVIEALQEDALRAMETLAMVSQEIESRKSEQPDEMAQAQTIAQDEMIETLKQAQKDALDVMVEKARDLTDLITTTRSMMLLLAGELPSEGRYDPDTWNYPHVVSWAQTATKTLVDAWLAMTQAQNLTQSAVREIGNMRTAYMTLQDADEPMDEPEPDGIPF